MHELKNRIRVSSMQAASQQKDSIPLLKLIAASPLSELIQALSGSRPFNEPDQQEQHDFLTVDNDTADHRRSRKWSHRVSRKISSTSMASSIGLTSLGAVLDKYMSTHQNTSCLDAGTAAHSTVEQCQTIIRDLKETKESYPSVEREKSVANLESFIPKLLEHRSQLQKRLADLNEQVKLMGQCSANDAHHLETVLEASSESNPSDTPRRLSKNDEDRPAIIFHRTSVSNTKEDFPEAMNRNRKQSEVSETLEQEEGQLFPAERKNSSKDRKPSMNDQVIAKSRKTSSPDRHKTEEITPSSRDKRAHSMDRGPKQTTNTSKLEKSAQSLHKMNAAEELTSLKASSIAASVRSDTIDMEHVLGLSLPLSFLGLAINSISEYPQTDSKDGIAADGTMEPRKTIFTNEHLLQNSSMNTSQTKPSNEQPIGSPSKNHDNAGIYRAPTAPAPTRLLVQTDATKLPIRSTTFLASPPSSSSDKKTIGRCSSTISATVSVLQNQLRKSDSPTSTPGSPSNSVSVTRKQFLNNTDASTLLKESKKESTVIKELETSRMVSRLAAMFENNADAQGSPSLNASRSRKVSIPSSPSSRPTAFKTEPIKVAVKESEVPRTLDDQSTLSPVQDSTKPKKQDQIGLK